MKTISPAPKYRVLLILVPLFLLVSWLGIRGLNSDAFWLDEYWSIYHAGGAYFEPRSVADVWTHIAAEDMWQTPLYYMLLSGWGRLTGWSELAVRALSFFAGLIAVAFAYRLGRDLRSSLVGIAAAVVLGSSAYYVYFLHEARGYTLYVLFTLIIAWANWRLITGKRGAYLYVTLFFGIVGALYTHYFAGLTAIVLGLFHLLTVRAFPFRRNPRRWWQISGVFALAALAFTPWLVVLIGGVSEALRQVNVRGLGTLTAEQATRGLLYLFSNGSTGLLIVLLALSLKRRKESLWTCAWMLSVFALLLLINERLGVLLEVRYLLALWAPLAILAGMGIETLADYQYRWSAGVLAVIVAGGVWVSLDPVSSLLLHNPHWHLPWRETRSALQLHAEAGDEVVFLLPDWTWAVYHEVESEYYLHGLPVQPALLEQPDHYGYAGYQERGRALLGTNQRVWIASTPAQPLNHRDEVEDLLTEAGFHLCGMAADTPDLTLALFARPPENAVPIRFGSNARLGFLLLTPLSAPLIANDTLNLTAILSADDPASAQRYSVGLHVQNAAGQLVAQVDFGVPPAAESCHSADLSIERVPPGTYDLLVTLYAWETGERVQPNAAPDVTITPDSRVWLGTVQISG